MPEESTSGSVTSARVAAADNKTMTAAVKRNLAFIIANPLLQK